MLRKLFSRWFFLHLIISVTITAAFLIVAIIYQRQASEKAVVHAKLLLAGEFSTLSVRLQSAIAIRTAIVRSMAHIIESNPTLSPEEFTKLASQMTKNAPPFRNLAAAPDLVIRYIFPIKGNEAALGLDYRAVPAQLAAVEKTREIGGTVVTGPVHLVQGGEGFIIRHPVNIRNPLTGQDRFWGIMSGVVSAEQIYAEIWPFVISVRTKVALRHLGDNGAPQKVFLGDASVFAADPITQEIRLSNATWTIAAIPAAGWPQHANSYRTIWIIFATTCALSLVLVNVSLMLVEKRTQMRRTLESAIEAIPSGFVIYDKHDRLFVVNSKFRDDYKTAADAIRVGESFERILRDAIALGEFPDAVGCEEEWIKKRMDDHRTANSIVEQKTNDGRWIRVEERPISDGSRVSIRTDITALKQAIEAAEEASRLKSEFLSVMSHELLTPLTVILGYTPLLASLDVLPNFRAMQTSLASLRTTHPDHVKAVETVMNDVSGFASTMDKKGKHLLSLINNILDISKIEAGKMTLNKEAVDSDEVVQSVVEQLQPIAMNKNITLESSPGGALVLAEKTRLKQILINLIGNAVKFTDAGYVRVETSRKEGFLEFRVSDTGPGIPDCYKKSLFNQFTQIDSTDERKFGGTGLGLAISEKLVKLHGGTMGFTSEVGKGSIFCFTIPLETATRKAA